MKAYRFDTSKAYDWWQNSLEDGENTRVLLITHKVAPSVEWLISKSEALKNLGVSEVELGPTDIGEFYNDNQKIGFDKINSSGCERLYTKHEIDWHWYQHGDDADVFRSSNDPGLATCSALEDESDCPTLLIELPFMYEYEDGIPWDWWLNNLETLKELNVREIKLPYISFDFDEITSRPFELISNVLFEHHIKDGRSIAKGATGIKFEVDDLFGVQVSWISELEPGFLFAIRQLRNTAEKSSVFAEGLRKATDSAPRP